MVYTRSEIIDLVQREPIELRSILVALIWYCSHCDPNLITDGKRFGLTQLPISLAVLAGFSCHPNQLLDVPLNISMASELLQEFGLLEFLGRDFAGQFHAITAMARFLDQPPSEMTKQ